MNHSWDVIRNQVRQFRADLTSIYPVQVLAVVKDFCIHNNILYFLSNNRTPGDLTPSRYLNIYKVDLKQFDSLHNLTLLKSAIAFTDYTALEEKEGGSYHRQFRIPGVSTLTMSKDTILFTFNNAIYVGPIDSVPKLIPYNSPVDLNTNNRSKSPSSPMINHIDAPPTMQTNYDPPVRTDPKLGGANNDLVSFIRDGDIWITDFDGNEQRLTNSTEQYTRCGIAEYMMQEEFHRFTGYYWCPHANKILYLETSEKDVEIVYISKAEHSIRYPRAGKINAKSELKIVDFSGDQVVHYQLWNGDDLRVQFPWMEYIVRFGWLPDGNSIWIQALSRDQKRTAVLKLYPSQFTITPIIHTNNNQQSTPLRTTEILWEETSTYWINITDVYHFFDAPSFDCVKFIWSSEKSKNGFRHLYYVEKHHNETSPRIKQLTHGDWCCIDKPLYIDELKRLVYFSAKKETPLETHFYSVNYLKDEEEPRRWTEKGYSHTVTMISSEYFIDCFSTLHDPQTILVRRVTNDTSALLFPVVPINLDCINQSIINTNLTSNNSLQRPYSTDVATTSVPNGEIFSFTTSDGIVLYGCLYKPKSYQPNQSYPTILHIYGGPKTQLVMNEFKFPRLMRYLMSVYFGFAVVIIDSRGSSDRGLQFESYIQYNLGTVELRDQMEGLQYLNDTRFGSSEGGSERKSVIDLKRVAITGWSYGGYLSLMALAQYPEFFKMAIAGAPVTQWELYDAAYTERYMGLPQAYPQAYLKSSILTHVDKFPDNENRLLIAHGLIDENVHFKNTEMLVSQLVKHNKPHYLQVYPSEKHGLRHASVNEHFETLMFYWLKNYL